MSKILGGSTSAAGAAEFFGVRVRFDDPRHVVAMTGDLDLASRSTAMRACTTTGHLAVVVDLADLEFMDCSGYGALVDSRAILEDRGGSLSLLGPVGEPLRLLSLLEQIVREQAPLLRHTRLPMPMPMPMPVSSEPADEDGAVA